MNVLNLIKSQIYFEIIQMKNRITLSTNKNITWFSKNCIFGDAMAGLKSGYQRHDSIQCSESTAPCLEIPATVKVQGFKAKHSVCW